MRSTLAAVTLVLGIIGSLVGPVPPWVVALPAAVGLLHTLWKESAARKQHTTHIIRQRVEEFRNLVRAGNPDKSIFSHPSLARAETGRSLWARYGCEKAAYIDRLVTCDVEEHLEDKPEAAFARLCSWSMDLGNFIGYFREYREKKGALDDKEKDWYNKHPIAAYHTYVNALRAAAEELSRYLGEGVKREARNVDDNKPSLA